ncbi:MAG: hypothetical protein CBC89_04075 [Euryarchaeota archaeon TMED129]|nr:MAG: hypothetical protein CBC89_04075 [Euryarchaeota archaeon TMED129]
MPSNPFVFEILELASKQRSKAKKIEILKTYDHISLKSIFIWNFDESVISMLPPGDVPYGDSDDQSVYSGTLSENIAKEAKGGESATGQDLDGRGKTSLRREYQNLYHFVKGGNDSLSSIRRETMFINMLRGLHPKEAEVLIYVKDKRLTEKYNINLDIVKEAYPDINWGGRSWQQP